MLPSTGLFKSIQCPLYDSQRSCSRPYCHFRHTKKDEESNQVPVYIPTPKVLPQLLTLDNSHIKKNRSKLEYIPTKPEINDSPNNKSYIPISSDIPVYIPSNKGDTNDEEKHELNKLEFDADPAKLDISDIVAKFSEEEDNLETKINIEEKEISISANLITEKEKEKKIEDEKDSKLNNSVNCITKDQNSKEKSKQKEKIYIKTDVKNNFLEENNLKTIEKHKSKHRHNSSNSNRDKEEKKHRDRHKSSSEKEYKEKRDLIEKKHHSSKSTHTSSKSKSKNDSPTTKKHSHRHSPSSSHTSRKKSSHKTKESDNKKIPSSKSKTINTFKSETLNKKKNLLQECMVDSAGSDEDDVMEQCKQIFEEFNNTQKKHDSNPVKNQNSGLAQKRKSLELIDEISHDDVIKRKRIAHESASVGKILEPPLPRKPNHVQSAFQSIYSRQEVLQKSQKEKEAAAFALVKEAEEKLREAEENLRRATLAQKQNLTPLIPKSYLTPPKISIKPIVNYLALEKAKKKVEEMRKNKGPTLAQSIVKGSSRVAHNPKTSTTITGSQGSQNLNKDQIQNQPAPPVLEPNSTKISYNIRMQNYNQMVKYCLDIYPKCEEAWERAQAEELNVFKKCSTPIIYRSSAILAINKLRKESIAAGNVCTPKNKTISHEVILAGKFASNVSVNKKNNPKNPFDRVSSEKVYDLICELCLTEEQLLQNGYPRPGPKRGTAIIQNVRRQAKAIRENDRICRRCSKTFNIEMYEYEAIDECCYHPKGTGYRRGFTDNYHHCCQQPAGSPGCTYANYHVTDNIDLNNLKGFVETMEKSEDYIPTKKDIYALDCEMCYTTEGIELTRITVVNFDEKVVYDALVKPENKIIDYNTVYSGITEDMLKNETRSIRDVQAILLSIFNSKTILIGHSLESDMKALKLIHSSVVDTSVLYPHKMGPPKKRALKNLCIENLKRIIQEDDGGHNSAEDAEVCIALVKHYLKIKIN